MREYFTLAYKDFADITEFLDHIKLLEEQIYAKRVIMSQDKRTLLCRTVAPLDVTHFYLFV